MFKSILLILMISLLSPFAFAQKIKVKKIKGNTALIESSVPLEEGQSYNLATESITQDVDYTTTGFKSRQHSLMLGGQLQSLKGNDYQKNLISLQARYGWTFTTLEFGPLGQLTSEDLGAGLTSEFALGGYVDYNLVPNVGGKKQIYGLVGVLSFGSKLFPASAGGGSASTLEGNAGGFISWFLNSTSTALRIEAFLAAQQISTTVKQTSIFGAGSRLLLLYYF